jgi:hypothetical protein
MYRVSDVALQQPSAPPTAGAFTVKRMTSPPGGSRSRSIRKPIRGSAGHRRPPLQPVSGNAAAILGALRDDVSELDSEHHSAVQAGRRLCLHGACRSDADRRVERRRRGRHGPRLLRIDNSNQFQVRPRRSSSGWSRSTGFTGPGGRPPRTAAALRGFLPRVEAFVHIQRRSGRGGRARACTRGCGGRTAAARGGTANTTCCCRVPAPTFGACAPSPATAATVPSAVSQIPVAQ